MFNLHPLLICYLIGNTCFFFSFLALVTHILLRFTWIISSGSLSESACNEWALFLPSSIFSSWIVPPSLLNDGLFTILGPWAGALDEFLTTLEANFNFSYLNLTTPTLASSSSSSQSFSRSTRKSWILTTSLFYYSLTSSPVVWSCVLPKYSESLLVWGRWMTVWLCLPFPFFFSFIFVSIWLIKSARSTSPSMYLSTKSPFFLLLPLPFPSWIFLTSLANSF